MSRRHRRRKKRWPPATITEVRYQPPPPDGPPAAPIGAMPAQGLRGQPGPDDFGKDEDLPTSTVLLNHPTPAQLRYYHRRQARLIEGRREEDDC